MRGKFLDFWRRVETGPIMFEKEFETRHYWPLLKETAKKYKIEYKEKDGKHSGVELLTELLTQGAMKMDLYLKVREAVENYETPYEITLRDGEKN